MITSPFEPKELLARIRMVLRRTQRDLEANPLTRLPGNVAILNELSSCIEKKTPFAVCYVDLDKFKAYNDKYGFEHGDDVIRETARILLCATKELGNPGDFVGHIGGDDFVIITTPNISDSICEKVIRDFDKISPSFYNQEDRDNGFVIGYDRQSKIHKILLLSVSIGVVTNELRQITHVAEVGEIGAELKKLAKGMEKSNYVKDKRQKIP
jgi:diguanylate cyclase (GGDEF)-like protein